MTDDLIQIRSFSENDIDVIVEFSFRALGSRVRVSAKGSRRRRLSSSAPGLDSGSGCVGAIELYER
jgi:hypothetical protein